VDPATARWARGPDDFAARIELRDLRGFLARGLVIEPGVCAIFMEEGRAEYGQVGPGNYALDTLLDRLPGMRNNRSVTAIVADEGEVALPFVLPGLPTADGGRVTVEAGLCFRLTDGLAFLVNFMKNRNRVSQDDLRTHLLPEVRNAAGEWAAPRQAADLSGSLVQKDALANAVSEHLRETLAKLGLRFERVRSLMIQT
jgi:membrane protease subunit (stomatin/prohibitin family)